MFAIAISGCHRDEAARPPTATVETTVAAAMSLRSVLPGLLSAFRAKYPGGEIVVNYGASGELKRQVEAGAPVDLVLFASAAPVDALIKSGRADGATRRVLASNELVLVGPKGSAPLTFDTLEKMRAGEMLAVGDPGAVPAGQYARDGLTKLGKWNALLEAKRIVFAGDVGAVLTQARRKEVAAAIVYQTDLHGVDDVEVLDRARGNWAPRPQVVAATISGGPSVVRGRALLDFVASPEAAAIWRDYGFGPP